MAEEKRIELAHKNITILVTPELERIRQKIQKEFDDRFAISFNPEGKTQKEIIEHEYEHGKSVGLAMALEIIDQETIINQ